MARHFAGRHGAKRIDWKGQFEECRKALTAARADLAMANMANAKLRMEPSKPEPNSEWQEGFVKIGQTVNGLQEAPGRPDHMRIQLAVWVRKP